VASKPRGMGIDRGGDDLTGDEWNTRRVARWWRRLGEARACPSYLNLEEEEEDGERSLGSS
jgi:hypothetical protein